ncbi:hypothetical protein [Arthrobacter sp.]|uniref:hypothetical protein n=1 Tax=Arthrobacter sp. TaxID=1667 RepID=UPI00258934FA|nr:hypothetical protein [Arthrobacter sp.]
MFRTLGAICATALLAVCTATVASANTTTTTHGSTLDADIPATCQGAGSFTHYWGTGNWSGTSPLTTPVTPGSPRPPKAR